ncbi:uncharacterized protein SCHCODRAFT_02635970 [Schizophyllum commune H4-8]|uniref:MYND-type domain-containing protein n=1 Tax=Schizophyllum commune (strain H4-8 / FGSC 9210) TaxID=578458 RepID=D8QEQ3_SCHCM|nr:uncharacterized protein SCHCODRAFT_02635970 [Schizophyllum commune H4-8]KAI5888184.1 hypothetical protein SCHCODRAFT_02635970 [Schizophyllum commune H4-8]
MSDLGSPVAFEVTIASSHHAVVTLAFYYTGWALALATSAKPESSDLVEQVPITMMLSTISPELAFPPPNPKSGRQVFCIKTYSENEGMLEQLISLGVLAKMNTKELQNGPLVEVLMKDAWIAHACMKCVRDYGPVGLAKPFELPGEPQMLRCSKCKVARYCSAECQKEDLKAHKQTCKLWRTRPAEAARRMENERRAEMSRAMSLFGFKAM